MQNAFSLQDRKGSAMDNGWPSMGRIPMRKRNLFVLETAQDVARRSRRTEAVESIAPMLAVLEEITKGRVKMKTKCRVCGKRLMPTKETVYFVSPKLSVAEVLTKKQTIYEACDCPRCGCQAVLGIREPIFREDEKGNKDES